MSFPGESDTSFGYASCGSKVSDAKLEQYGESFDVDDVIGCFLVCFPCF